jgi:hypothetical protein
VIKSVLHHVAEAEQVESHTGHAILEMDDMPRNVLDSRVIKNAISPFSALCLVLSPSVFES